MNYLGMQLVEILNNPIVEVSWWGLAVLVIYLFMLAACIYGFWIIGKGMWHLIQAWRAYINRTRPSFMRRIQSYPSHLPEHYQ